MPLLRTLESLDIEMADRLPSLPAHIEDTVRSIADLHAQQREGTAVPQRIVDRATAWVGRPAFMGILTLIISAWVFGTLFIGRLSA